MDYVPLCEPWPVSCVNWTGVSPAVTGQAVEAASEWLWALSGRQFGSCPVLVRPCRDDCNIGAGWWWDGIRWPADTYGPGWLGIACGNCRGACSCSAYSSVRLAHSVSEITSVTIDGVVLPASGYGLYDGDTLIRADGGMWPRCQDWRVGLDAPGSWGITAVYGQPVPALGEMAMGEAAREFGLACTSGAVCRLASNVTSIVRNGVTQQLASPEALARQGVTELGMVNKFIDAVNPDRLRSSARIWNPDDFTTPRRPGPRVGW